MKSKSATKIKEIDLSCLTTDPDESTARKKSNSKQEKRRPPKIVNDDVYFFVAYNPEGDAWQPAYATTDMRYPFATNRDLYCYEKITAPLKKFWRRNVLDRIYPNNTNAGTCDLATVRLIKANITYEDITHELMPGPEETEERKRNATLARLTREEARLLGVETEYAMMLLTRKEASDWDEKLAGKVVSRASITLPSALQKVADPT